MKRARVVSFLNYKGGVGKTTTTYHIGCSLAEHHGKRVLLIDIDPQSNLSLLCMSFERYDEVRRQQGTIRDLYRRYREDFHPLESRKFIVKGAVGGGDGDALAGVDLLPCDIDLLGEDLAGFVPTVSAARSYNAFQILEQIAQRTLQQWEFLRTVCEEVDEDYDYILIDCPPNIYLMTQNALCASDWYIVTLIPEFLSTLGLEILARKIDDLTKRIQKVAAVAGVDNLLSVKLAGIIWVKKRNTKQHEQTVQKLLAGPYGPYVFECGTLERIGYAEAAEMLSPVWRAPTANAREAAGFREYERITEEFLQRCA